MQLYGWTIGLACYNVFMPRHERPNPYQRAFDFSARETVQSQHVRLVEEPHIIQTPADAATYLMDQVFFPFEQFRQEQLYVLLLDVKNHITHDVMVYKGTVNTVNIRIAELFMEAVRVNAPSIIMSHCHPSGDPTPSPEDVKATQFAYEAGKLLDISVLDHIIVGKKRWVSLKERGQGFSLT